MQWLYMILGYPLGWVMWLCYKVIPIYGVSLILFTIITRGILVPFSIKQQKSMVKMQIFKPRMDEIQKKYANNKEKLNEELMKLYEEEGYNPMSGCLPMVIQFPILFGLIDVIYKPMTHILRMGADLISQAASIAAPILNVEVAALTKDYSSQLKIIGAAQQNPDAFSNLPGFMDAVSTLNLHFLGIDLTQTPTLAFNLLILVPVLSGITSLLVSFFTMKQTAATAGDNPQMAGMTKSMFFMMPVMSIWFAFILPAGVGIYWIISNLLMAVQTYLLNKYMNPGKLAEEAKKEYEERKEVERQKRIEAKKKLREQGVPDDDTVPLKELNRQRLAAARKRDAERYGEEYKEVTDEDLK